MTTKITGELDVHVSVTARTDLGRRRDNNEDAFLVADLTTGRRIDQACGIERIDVGKKGVLLVVSDGVAGQTAGEVASALVVDGLARALEVAPANAPPAVQLRHAAAKAHLDVLAAARRHGRRGMGATLTAVYLTGGSAYVAEVGDSRAYLLRAGRIFQLTRDQSVAQVLIDSGALAPEEGKTSPMRHILVQAMGHDSAVQVALGKLELRDRDCLLLCSDGLTAKVTDEEIRRGILESKSLDVACERLVSKANERGGADNITVVIAGVGGNLPRTRADERVSTTYEILETFAPPRPARKADAPLVPATVKVTL
jgi:PPM family protein phosphatase